MDIELMRRLSPRVNVIPVIGKSDSLTPSELKGFKKRVSVELYPLEKLFTEFISRSWRISSTTASLSTTSLMMSRKTTKRPSSTTANYGSVKHSQSGLVFP